MNMFTHKGKRVHADVRMHHTCDTHIHAPARKFIRQLPIVTQIHAPAHKCK